MRILLSISFMIFVIAYADGQPTAPIWTAAYNTNIPQNEYHLTDFAVDSAGNSYVLSQVMDSALINPDVGLCLLKYNSNGLLLWSDTMGFVFGKFTLEIGQQGHIYVVATTDTGSAFEFVVRKLDGSGNEIRTLHYSMAQGYFSGYLNNTSLDNSENLYLVGHTTNQDNAITMKFDSSGTVLWQAAFSRHQYAYDRAQAVHFDTQGNTYVTISSQDTIGTPDVFLLKYSLTGVLIWQQYLNNPHYEVPKFIEIYNDTSIYIAGDCSNFSPGDYLILKFDSSGQLVWHRVFNAQAYYNFPANASDNVLDMLVVDNGDVVVTGSAFNGTGSPRRVTVAYDKSGNLRWVDRDFYASEGYSLSKDRDGHVLVAGWASDTSLSLYGLGLTKYDTSGTKVWSNFYVPSANEYCMYALADFDHTGNIYASCDIGSSSGESLLTIKYGYSVGLNEYFNEQVAVNAFPNPCVSSFMIRATDNILSVRIYDVDGKLIDEQVSIQQTSCEVSLELFPSGLYTYTIELENSQSSSGKIIKQ